MHADNLVSFPEAQERIKRQVPAAQQALNSVGVKVDAAGAQEFLEGLEAHRRRRRAQIEAGMSHEERMDELARELAQHLAKAPRRPAEDEEAKRARRAAVEERAKSGDLAARLALEMVDRMKRVTGEELEA
jgi:hypothetical protein